MVSRWLLRMLVRLGDAVREERLRSRRRATTLRMDAALSTLARDYDAPEPPDAGGRPW